MLNVIVLTCLYKICSLEGGGEDINSRWNEAGKLSALFISRLQTDQFNRDLIS